MRCGLGTRCCVEECEDYKENHRKEVSPVNNQSAYWIVVGPKGPSPWPHRHRTKNLALNEARRLAVLYVGSEFTVFMAVRSTVVISPTRETDFVGDEEIPF